MKNLKKQTSTIFCKMFKVKRVMFILVMLFSTLGAFAQSYTPEQMLEEGYVGDYADYDTYYDGGLVPLTTPAKDWVLATHAYGLWEIHVIDNVQGDILTGMMATNRNVIRTGWTAGTLVVTERTNYGQWFSGEVTVTVTAEIQLGFAGLPPIGHAYRNSHTYYAQ